MSAITATRRDHRRPVRLRGAAVFAATFATFVGACSAGAPAGPTPTTGAATVTPTVVTSPDPAPTPTPKPSLAVHLSGGFFYARFVESTHSFAGMFVARSDGSGEVEVRMPWTEGGGRWSRAGTSISVATQLPDGRIGTAIIGQDGSVARVLAIPDPTLNLPCSAWSRDDKRLACLGWADDPARAGIYTVRASDGGDLRRITSPPAGMTDEVGDYSPSGQFVFRRHAGDEGPGRLFLVAATGGTPRQLSSASLEDDGRFSPDGTLVLSADEDSIQIFDLNGKVVHRFSVSGAALFGPVWSPDGKRIAFSLASVGPFADVYTSLPDGTDRQRITSTSENEITIDWAKESR